jgi:glyoxalase family protein
VKLEGIHHVTCITADAPQNVLFYADTLGLRLVKKSVNQDVPTIYHLFYASENGDAGSDITFFEYPGVERGHAGAGMIHRIRFRVDSQQSLEFWEKRLSSRDVVVTHGDDHLHFDDPEGLTLELAVVSVPDAPLRAKHPEIPEEHALGGFDGVRAYTTDADDSRPLFEGALGFQQMSEAAWEIRGSKRGSVYAFDEARGAGMQGAGTVHHVAWACEMDEHAEWRKRVAAAGMNVTPVIDRYYFRSIYFREPSGVLFEIATLGPGFTVDEPLEHLGESLSLPPDYKHLRDELAGKLTPLPDPRAAVRR